MSDWSHGYPTASAYLDAMQPEISPFRWRQSLLAARRLGPDERRPFRFLELGCGSATTLIALAACYPQAEFLGVDFMPEHVARARIMIEAAELPNIRVEEASFADLAAAPPPEKYDFAAAHGVWTWVAPEVRAEIVTLLNRWLAPGAIAYFGYNAAAGWAAAAPLRRLFQELPQGTGRDRFAAARAAAQSWIDTVKPKGFETLWSKLSGLPDDYIAHEIAGPHGTGIWPGELAGALAEAKLAYSCPAVFAEQFDALFLPPERIEFLRKARAEGWGETARDLALGRTFREDLFHRGAPALSLGEMQAGFAGLQAALWSSALELADFRPSLGTPLHGVDPAVLATLEAAIGHAPAPFSAFIEALEIEPIKALQALFVAISTGALMPLRGPDAIAAATPGCARFNAIARRQLEAGRTMQGLASPAIGGVVPLSAAQQRVAFGIEPGEADLTSALSLLGLMA